MSPSERRFYERYCASPLQVSVRRSSPWFSWLGNRRAIGLDFAQGGMAIASTMSLSVGSRIQLQLSSDYLHLQAVPAEVVRKKKTDQSYEYGLRFLFGSLPNSAQHSANGMLQLLEDRLKYSPEQSAGTT